MPAGPRPPATPHLGQAAASSPPVPDGLHQKVNEENFRKTHRQPGGQVIPAEVDLVVFKRRIQAAVHCRR